MNLHLVPEMITHFVLKKKVKVKTIQKSKEEGASDEQEFKEASEDLLKLSGRDHKFTQPMCISSFEEFNIIVFALANRQVILYEVKQTG